MERALLVQTPLARKNVERLRRIHPQASPSEVVKKLDVAYLSAVTISGGASGAAGMVPGGGIPTAVADVMVFTEATALYVLSRAEVHGLHPEDAERRRLLVYVVLIGDSANSALGKAIPRAGGYWAKRIVESIPMSAVRSVNKALGPRFVTKYGTKQGVLVLSKQVPLGVGAVLGGGGNHVFGRLSIRTANKLFGPPPNTWPKHAGGRNGMDPDADDEP